MTTEPTTKPKDRGGLVKKEDKAELVSLKEWGSIVLQTGLLPRDTNVSQAMVMVQSGKEMGLHPLQSIRCMSFIRGRLCMKVELQLALAKNRGVVVKNLQSTDNDCKVTLGRGEEEITCTYSMKDADRAGLIRADGNWYKYPRQMLRWRAIGDALRLIAPDFTMGIMSPDEAEHLPDMVTIEGSALPGKPVVEMPKPKELPTKAFSKGPQKSKGNGDKKASPAQIKALRETMARTGFKDTDICLKFKLKTLDDITSNDFEKAIKIALKGDTPD